MRQLGYIIETSFNPEVDQRPGVVYRPVVTGLGHTVVGERFSGNRIAVIDYLKELGESHGMEWIGFLDPIRMIELNAEQPCVHVNH